MFYQLVDVSDDGFLTLMDGVTGSTKESLSLKDFDHADKLREAFIEQGKDVTVMRTRDGR